MKKLIAAFIVSLLSMSALANEPNKKCPVSGKDVDATKTRTVSVTIGFCCEKCPAKFEADAAAKTAAVKNYAGSKDSPANKKCPLSNKDVVAGKTTTATMTVAFCCEKCPAEFDKDPKKYLAKLQ